MEVVPLPPSTSEAVPSLGALSPGEVTAILADDCLGLRGRSLLSVADLVPDQLAGLLRIAASMAVGRRLDGSWTNWRGRRCLAMLFEKASLRTRVTFELGMTELDGVAIVLGPSEVGLGTRESVPDVGRNLSCWVDAIMARVFDHQTLVKLRDSSGLPVINALSDVEHPCQALADLQTLIACKGDLAGRKLAWVGDGNNVLNSLMLGCAPLGVSIAAACPDGYQPPKDIVASARDRLRGGATISVCSDAVDAVCDADAVYTDTWTSMGQESEAAERKRVFAPYCVDAELMARAKPDAVFMHCMPAHRGEEVTDEVIDGQQSVVMMQAQNRLHAQKAVLAALIGV